jgi:hypothetical protein
VQIDPNAWRIMRAGTGVTYAPASWFSLGVDYVYTRAKPELGIVDDDHQITGTASVTPIDYYTLTTGTTWNLRTNSWAESTVGVGYDDGYLALGGNLNFTPASWGFGLSFNLKDPSGEVAF